MWEVEYTDEFENWWNTLTEKEMVDIAACVGLLEEYGPNLKHPFSSGINDPRRVAILLIGGNKTGDDRWYERFVPIADKLYGEHLSALKKEGLRDG